MGAIHVGGRRAGCCGRRRSWGGAGNASGSGRGARGQAARATDWQGAQRPHPHQTSPVGHAGRGRPLPQEERPPTSEGTFSPAGGAQARDRIDGPNETCLSPHRQAPTWHRARLSGVRAGQGHVKVPRPAGWTADRGSRSGDSTGSASLHLPSVERTASPGAPLVGVVDGPLGACVLKEEGLTPVTSAP